MDILSWSAIWGSLLQLLGLKVNRKGKKEKGKKKKKITES